MPLAPRTLRLALADMLLAMVLLTEALDSVLDSVLAEAVVEVLAAEVPVLLSLLVEILLEGRRLLTPHSDFRPSHLKPQSSFYTARYHASAFSQITSLDGSLMILPDAREI
ncbi:hypothetical protein DFP73DRAFT_629496 [Morchella snyderi]|nr:hypothetical protein DFP73DRAFT_629496 [Morchella snyderi]